MKLRSLVFLFFLCVYMLIMSLTALVFGLLLPMRVRMMFTVVTEKYISLLLRWCCSITVSVEGKDNLKRLNGHGGAVVVANHQSPWETFYLQTLFFPLTSVLKRELLRIPFFGWTLTMIDPIVLDRSKKLSSAQQIIRQGKDRLSQGFNLLIFPQGTRMPPGRIGRFSRTAAELAVLTGCQIIPVAHNAGDCWPGKSLWKRSGTIRLVIAEPVDASFGDSRQITEYCSRWIAQKAGLSR